MGVEEILMSNMNELDVQNGTGDQINNYLSLIRCKHIPTYEHCIRVGDRSRKIAECLGFSGREAWYVGTLHDVGKSLIRRSLLDKKERFSEGDMDEMKWHVIYSHKLLRDVFNFSAEAALRHHRYQKNSYPLELLEPCEGYSSETLKIIDDYARIVAIADFYDALTTRNNENYKEERMNFSSKDILIKAFPDQSDKIKTIFERKILI